MASLRSIAPVLALTLFLSLMGCSKGVTGIYVHDKNKQEYLELKSDSAFVVHGMGGQSLSGKYKVEGEVVTLTLDRGPAVKARINGSVFTDPAGESWIKGEKPSNTAAASANGFSVDPARQAANESAAASTVRTLNTSEVTYATTYPAAGYAPKLSVLGPGGANCSSPSADHACLVEQALGCASASCVKYNYRFTIVSGSAAAPFGDYTITATPADSTSGKKNFCANADAIIRLQVGPPLDKPLTAKECAGWPPIQ
ncbi:MAG TPA: hypothetical protein VFR84_08115 [Candidatus Angelobacter sp.]|nr:hypothetical protein [Candidatus Angelobacter sp.]